MAKRKTTVTVDDDKYERVRQILGTDTLSGTLDRAFDRVLARASAEHDARIYANTAWSDDEQSLMNYVSPHVEVDDDFDWSEDYPDVSERHAEAS